MSKNENIDKLKTIVSLCKRRGFIYPGSDIYGGFANTYSYGPYGAELKKQIKELWWKEFVHKRPDMVGIDGPILLHPKVWEASGHASSFSDALVDCKECKFRFRADHLLEEALGEDVEGLSPQEMSLKISEGDVKCPKCKAQNFTEVRNFNLMFKTELSKTGDHGNVAYLILSYTASSSLRSYLSTVEGHANTLSMETHKSGGRTPLQGDNGPGYI